MTSVTLFRDTDLGLITELDHYDLSVLENGVWFKSLIGLGRHQDSFQVCKSNL